MIVSKDICQEPIGKIGSSSRNGCKDEGHDSVENKENGSWEAETGINLP